MKNNNVNASESATQCQRIAAALERGETISPVDALNRFGCFRLGARIYDLQNKGYKIQRAWGGKGKKKFMTYKLAQ